MTDNELTLNPEDRVLFIINDNVIQGATRFQKYGFVIFKQYQKELAELNLSYNRSFNFYEDWKPHRFGPYSEQLTQDIKNCVTNGILDEKMIDKDRGFKQYFLTLKGRIKWRKIFFNTTDEVIKINNKIRYLQTMKLVELLRQVYDAYPKYTTKSRIKDSLI